MTNKLTWILLFSLALTPYACREVEVKPPILRHPDEETTEETTEEDTEEDTEEVLEGGIEISDSFRVVVSSEDGCTFTWEDVELIPSDAEIVAIDSVEFNFVETEWVLEWGEDAPRAEIMAPEAVKSDTLTTLIWKVIDDVRTPVDPYVLIPINDADDTDYSYIGTTRSTEPPNGTWTLTMLSRCEQVNAEGLTLTIYARYSSGE